MENMDFGPQMNSKMHETKVTRNNKFEEVIDDHQNDEIDHILRGGGSYTDNQEVIINIETSKRWWIERVPPHVREVDKKAYTPKILSIGPFHHNEPCLKAMEIHKLRFLKRFGDQIFQNKLKQRISINDLESLMKALEPNVRECYSEEFEHICSDDFVRMLVLDAFFIVELLRLHGRGFQGEDVQEPIFGTRWMLVIIGRDLLLTENQLPMFVLQKMFDLTTYSDNPTPLHKLALHFFKNYLKPLPTGELPNQLGTNTSQGNNPDHLLALFQSSFILIKNTNTTINTNINITGCSCLPHNTCSSGKYCLSSNNNIASSNYNFLCCSACQGSSSTVENADNSSLPNNVGNQLRLPQRGWIQNAKALSWAGITFSTKAGDHSGLEVEFKGNKLMISPLLLGDDTYVHLLRNLLAYEQSSTRVSPYVTCFVIFLGSLVDEPGDIKILLDNGIIKNAKGGNGKIVNLVKSLGWELRFDMKDCYLSKQVKQINRFSQSRRGKIRRATVAALKKIAPFFKWLVVTCFFVQLPVMQYGVKCGRK